MLIPSQKLSSTLATKTYPLYILSGQNTHLLNDTTRQIKNALHQRTECDTHIIDLHTPSDWEKVLEKTQTYSLFATHTLLDLRLDKKSIDTAGKTFLKDWLKKTPTHCTLMLQAPLVSVKELQGFSALETVCVVQLTLLNAVALQQWITEQLKNAGLSFDSSIPALIHQYTQGNLLACGQAIERLTLVYEQNQTLTPAMVAEQLYDQCQYQMYELSEACLSAQVPKAIHLLRHAREERIEPTFVLWILTQEIRQLLLLAHQLEQSTPFSQACTQLKIWPSRVKLYQAALKRLSSKQLEQYLQDAQHLDLHIKSHQNTQVWQSLEQLSLSLCSVI